jgi:hypothetical protein
MKGYGLGGVVGTARVKPAVVSENGAHEVLITSDNGDQKRAHNCRRIFTQCPEREALSVRFDELAARCWQRTTKSTCPNACRCRRKLSRTIRLIRVRSTARRTPRLEIARPNRARLALFRHAKTVKQSSIDLTGRAKTRWYSVDRLRRADRGNRASVSVAPRLTE